jgi:hypothetical protein
VLNALPTAKFFAGSARANKLDGVWQAFVGPCEHGIEPTGGDDPASEEIAGWAKELLAEMPAATDVDEQCIARLVQYVHERLHPPESKGSDPSTKQP